MRVLLLTNYFPPEIGGASHLFYELASSLTERGHNVTVVTGFPRYNVQEVDARYRRKLLLSENIDGIQVLRIRTIPLPKGSRIARGIDHFAVSAMFALRGMFSGLQDVILIYSPPLPLGLAAWLVGRLKGIPFVVNVQDLFPQEAIDLGLLTNPILIRIFEAIEAFIYRRADHIAVHSPGNQEHVIARGGYPDRVSVVYNWVDTKRIAPQDKDNEFARTHNLNGYFVVSYAGTMGWCQDMDTIVRAAYLLKEYKDILFLMVGDGVEKGKAQQQAKELGLSNIKWLPMQPWDVYPQILAASDISMINLNENLRTPVVPSKLLSIMAAGRPVVASLPLDGDAPRIIEEAKAGLCVGPGDPEALAEVLLQLYNQPELCHQYGVNGRRYAETHFSRDVCVGQYEEIFLSVRSR